MKKRFTEEQTIGFLREAEAATPVTACYLRVTAQNYGLLPVGHEGAGKPAFLFADEILMQ